MSYPANLDFENDPAVTLARWKVYVRYCRKHLVFHEPRLVKVRALVFSLHMGYSQAIPALDWLIEQGYLVEHDGDQPRTRYARRPRLLSLAYAREFRNGSSSAA